MKNYYCKRCKREVAGFVLDKDGKVACGYCLKSDKVIEKWKI